MEIPWKPDELAFIAEEEAMIKITPNFTSGKIQFLSRECGPFKAQIAMKVPLWLALFLHSNKSCALIPPKWLCTSHLRRILEGEKSTPDSLTKLPNFFIEIAFAFFSRARDVITDSDNVQSIVNHIWEIRTEKLRKSIVSNITGLYDNFEFPNATKMEIHLFRYSISQVTELLMNLYTTSHHQIESDEEP